MIEEKQGADRFFDELTALGFSPERDNSHGVWFGYQVENGPRRGEQLELGFVVPPNWPVEPPHGPNYRPAILRNAGVAGVHPGRELGPDWDHWSRPHPQWAQTDYTVRAYMRYIRQLNEELPALPREEADAA
jgi:hypothetical protein